MRSQEKVQVKKFRYLESTLTEDWWCKVVIKVRIFMTEEVFQKQEEVVL